MIWTEAVEIRESSKDGTRTISNPNEYVLAQAAENSLRAPKQVTNSRPASEAFAD